MKKLMLCLVGMVFCVSMTFAQKDETLFNKTGIRITGGWGGTSLAVSKMDNDNAVFRGGFGGVELNKSIFLGWGGMELQNDVFLEELDGQLLDMSYNGFVAGYAPSAHKVFHPQFMLMVGGGNVDYEDFQGKDKIFVVQPSVGVEINIFRWFKLGLNGGYRIVTDTNIPNISDGDLSTPYGEVKFKFGWSWGR